MASVSSLDQDMKKLRLARYTPAAANEARAWIEETLGERLPPGDLLEALKDGVTLLANMALPPPGIKFKASAMPFVQMENISHFLRACESPPLNMPAHDRFLTVDLYESKDPAQVLQCLGAFSRVANKVNPSKFRTSIGPKRGGAMSPTPTGGSNGFGGRYSPTRGSGNASQAMPGAGRAMSPALTGGSSGSRTTEGTRGGTASPPAPTSSWSKRSDEGTTAPAWNIHQYGYMGGASQGNQGISFGARRQITSAAPYVPSIAEKERKRREAEAEAERLRIQAEEAEEKRRVERAAEEERAKAEEERKWEEDSRRAREQERLEVDRQKREWEEEERKWKEAEEKRREEERAEVERYEQEKAEVQRKRGGSDARLRGQYLSEYQKEARSQTSSRQVSGNYVDDEHNSEHDRVKELERQLEEAKAREAEYERERQDRFQREDDRAQRKDRARSRSPYMRQSRNGLGSSRPLPDPTASAPGLPARPLPDPGASSSGGARPLPDPERYQPGTNRTSRFLAQNAPPVAARPAVSTAPDAAISTSGEQEAEAARRLTSQQKTKAGGWASKSLLEREMERERERQREWEESQKESKAVAKDQESAFGPQGEGWDAHQYGYLGGDSQNRGAQGIGFGARRQIIGPRPQK
ncbi:hypothetical protein NA57DRAFT_42064 [Rhizodiscina lignyota]|uniref:Calponin-homology (CH) domain-containing protein n=1 Tax=Rhizodiscina lignyota TaxID=1504668 RepID=A0A9P4M467_9PEZI|nr:hypothetical protein NA57DRAFT_42064 [Rhizodiscina lignyota]